MCRSWIDLAVEVSHAPILTTVGPLRPKKGRFGPPNFAVSIFGPDRCVFMVHFYSLIGSQGKENIFGLTSLLTTRDNMQFKRRRTCCGEEKNEKIEEAFL